MHAALTASSAFPLFRGPDRIIGTHRLLKARLWPLHRRRRSSPTPSTTTQPTPAKRRGSPRCRPSLLLLHGKHQLGVETPDAERLENEHHERAGEAPKGNTISMCLVVVDRASRGNTHFRPGASQVVAPSQVLQRIAFRWSSAVLEFSAPTGLDAEPTGETVALRDMLLGDLRRGAQS